MRILKNFILFALILLPYIGKANHVIIPMVGNQIETNYLDYDNTVSCRTWTVGINIGIIFIETEVTLCCVVNIPPTFCFTIDKAMYHENEIDITNLTTQSRTSIPTVTIVSSSTEYFSDGEMRMELGSYIVSENGTIALRYDFVEY
ncbi:MAG: hypothetical protein QM478_12645 [Flavobacteriaceae bacterium]